MHTCTHATLLERLAIRSPSCSITLTNTFSFTREHGHIKGQPGLTGTLLVEHKGKSFLSLKTELGTAHSWWLSQFSAEDFKAGRGMVRTHWTVGPKAAVSPSFHGNLNTDYFYFVESEWYAFLPLFLFSKILYLSSITFITWIFVLDWHSWGGHLVLIGIYLVLLPSSDNVMS